MHGGVKFYRGSASAARNYVEADRSRADDGLTLPAYRCGKRAIRVKVEDLEAATRRVPSARW